VAGVFSGRDILATFFSPDRLRTGTVARVQNVPPNSLESQVNPMFAERSIGSSHARMLSLTAGTQRMLAVSPHFPEGFSAFFGAVRPRHIGPERSYSEWPSRSRSKVGLKRQSPLLLRRCHTKPNLEEIASVRKADAI
jgi:hypothetical protein